MYERLREQIKEAKADLEVVKVLTESLKQNSAFSRTLDGQADVIISRAAAVHRTFTYMSEDLDKMITELNAADSAKVPIPDASILFDPLKKVPVVEGQGIDLSKPTPFNPLPTNELDSATKELLEKFKDK